jgi:hypothetical protein
MKSQHEEQTFMDSLHVGLQTLEMVFVAMSKELQHLEFGAAHQT